MKKEIIAAMGVSALALSLGQSTVNAQEKGTVTVSALNIRSGPGLENSVKGCLYRGDIVTILERSNKWIKVQLSNNTTGWVSEDYINTNIQTETNAKVNCKDELNVRSGPGINYSIKTTVNNGTIHKILDKSEGWYKIELSTGVVGWVKGSYIIQTSSSITNIADDSDEDKQNNEIEENETSLNCNGKVISSVNLNVRSGPGTNYSIKTSLNPGSVINLLSKSNGWYKIEMQNKITGWVSSQYISITNETESDASSSSTKGKAIVSVAMAQLGKPYVWGGNGPNSFDCSGFTKYVYLHSIGISLPRVSYQQAIMGKTVNINNLQKGDLLYFATVIPGRTSHVGIYIGDNQFIHASGSQTRPDKVKISYLTGYYRNVLLGARRF